ncbi:MAG: c-type cytochrome [Ignavibacteriaceae bacterium]
MDFLDKLVIPLSPEHITLLRYISMLILFLFIPFISIILGGTAISLFYRRKGIKEGNNLYIRFAKDLIEIVTINKSIGIALGIMPLLTSILIFVQIFHNENLIVVSYLTGACLLVAAGLILIYTFRYSTAFNDIFNSIKELKTDESNLEAELNALRSGSSKLSTKSGRLGILLLIIGLWVFVSGLTVAIYQSGWNDSNMFSVLFSWIVITRFISFLLLAGAFTGAVILFSFFYWDGGIKGLDQDYKELVRKLGLNITSFTSIIIPVFLFVNVSALPESTLTRAVFAFVTIALLLLFLGYHYLYVMYKNSNAKYSMHLFISVLFTILAVIISDQTTIGEANAKQALVLGQNFEDTMQKINEANTPPVISGKDIYNNICSACHSFDHKVVGPPYKETLPKYNGDVAKLVTFILSPTQNNPGYPPMPNPGLNQAQAQAVAAYILKEVQKYK